MDVEQERILDYLVGYWREQFNLIPAVEVAEAFQIPPAETLKVLDAMAKEGLVELHQRRAGPADPGVLDRSVSETFRATYVLPSRSVLKARFEEAKQDFGHYKNLLYQGGDQEDLFRFRPTILDYYRQRQDIEVQHDLIVTKRTALKRGDVHSVYVRYRWATGLSGDRYILISLWDLAELSQEEQALWARHEIREQREAGA
ncbi:MAG: hypothetical protein ACE5I9_05095 [Candidatus Methylomirabilales bacterium]